MLVTFSFIPGSIRTIPLKNFGWEWEMSVTGISPFKIFHKKGKQRSRSLTILGGTHALVCVLFIWETSETSITCLGLLELHKPCSLDHGPWSLNGIRGRASGEQRARKISQSRNSQLRHSKGPPDSPIGRQQRITRWSRNLIHIENSKVATFIGEQVTN